MVLVQVNEVVVVENTSSSIEVATCNTLIRFHVYTTHTAFILLNLCSTEGIEQLVLYHSPLDRVRTLLVEITNVLSLEFFHRTPLHLDHSVIYIPHVILNLHISLEDFTCLVSLWNLIEEGVEDKSTILISVSYWEELGKVTYLQNTCDKCVLTKHDELISKTSIVYSFVVGSISTLCKHSCIKHLVLLKILITVLERLGVITSLLIECNAIYLFINFREGCSCSWISRNLIPAALHWEEWMLNTEEVVCCVSETINTQRNSINCLRRNIRCRLRAYCLNVRTHTLDSIEDAFKSRITLLCRRLCTVIISCCWRFTTIQNSLNSVQCLLKFIRLLSSLLGSLLGCDIISKRTLVLFLILCNEWVKLILCQAFVFEFLLKAKKLDDTH